MRDAFRGRPAKGLSLRWRRFFLAEPGGLTTRPFRARRARGRPQSAARAATSARSRAAAAAPWRFRGRDSTGVRLRISPGVVGASLLDERCHLAVAAAQEDPRLVRRVLGAVRVYIYPLFFFAVCVPSIVRDEELLPRQRGVMYRVVRNERSDTSCATVKMRRTQPRIRNVAGLQKNDTGAPTPRRTPVTQHPCRSQLWTQLTRTHAPKFEFQRRARASSDRGASSTTKTQAPRTELKSTNHRARQRRRRSRRERRRRKRRRGTQRLLQLPEDLDRQRVVGAEDAPRPLALFHEYGDGLEDVEVLLLLRRSWRVRRHGRLGRRGDGERTGENRAEQAPAPRPPRPWRAARGTPRRRPRGRARPAGPRRSRRARPGARRAATRRRRPGAGPRARRRPWRRRPAARRRPPRRPRRCGPRDDAAVDVAEPRVGVALALPLAGKVRRAC